MASSPLPSLAGFRAVLFDLDGVLTPTAEIHMRAWRALFENELESRGIAEPYTDDDYFRFIDGKKRDDGVASMLESRGIRLPLGAPDDPPESDTVWGLGNRKNAIFSAILERDGIEPFPGSLALVDRLRESGTTMGVVSSSKNAEWVLEAAKLRAPFAVVVDGVTAAQRGLASKPAPDMFVEGARELAVSPEDIVVFEDAISGVAAAHAGGFGLVIGVDRGVGEQALREAGAHLVIADLSEFADDVGTTTGTPHKASHIDRDRFPADPWRLREVQYSPHDVGVAETLFAVGNGFLGMRGNNVEGRRAHEHGTFINGLHETWRIRHAEQAYGFAEVGQTIVDAPDSKVMRLYVDDEPLAIDEADLLEYERSLDFSDGVLRRELLWLTPAGKRVRVSSSRMVSFPERHLAVLTLEVTMLDADAPLTISCQLLNRQDGEDEYAQAMKDGSNLDPRKAERIKDRVFHPGEYWQDGQRSALSYRIANSRMSVATVADHTVETENDVTSERFIGPDIAKNVFAVAAKRGKPVRITKVVSYHSSRTTPTHELIDRCRRTLERVHMEGIAAQYSKQRAWLDDFWYKSDVEIVGDDDLQQAVRWNLYQLAQATARADGFGIPAKGVTGSGYGGHYFWDTEIYMVPFLAYTSPLWARNALRAREHMLPLARDRARQLNEEGALFPWRTINGEEASAYYAAGTAQYHINADVTYALAKFIRATGDIDFLANGAIDIAVETARLWMTLGFWRSNGGDSFEIHGVTGPDEYTTVVNNNLFTNVMARFNLGYAATTVRDLERQRPEAYHRMVARLNLRDSELEEWERAAAAMTIPFSEVLQIHPQDSGFLEREVWDLANTPADQKPLMLHFHPLVIYRFQVLKQADVVLALFLQGDQFTREQKLADFDYYDPLTTSDSTLSNVVQSIIAAEIGYQDLALEYFEHSLFVDLADLHKNTSDGVHVASAGGVWNALVSGFGGMRDHGGELTFDPRLPASWPELRFRMIWHGTRMLVTVTKRAMRVSVLDGDAPVSFRVRGVDYTVAPDAAVEVALDGQGPILPGAPSQVQSARYRREDGTLMVPQVPTLTDSMPILPAQMVALDESSESTDARR